MVKKKQKFSNTVEEEKTISEKPSFDWKKINPWIISTIVLGLVLIILIGVNLKDKGISKQQAGGILKEFASLQGIDIEIKETKDLGGIYEVLFSFNGQEGKYYVSKDGKYVGQMIELKEIKNYLTGQAVKETPKEVPKTDVPKLELFVMTHCPYGTQAEKGFIPFIEAMKNKINAKIRFVHYFMHGQKEEEETYRQVCIREEQGDKYLIYLKEFLKEGNSSAAEKVAKIDGEKLKKCIESGKAKEYYKEDSELSQKYGVQGSPTLIVNEVEVLSGRSPAAYLETACSAFTTKPSECSTLKLSTQTPAPMWGWDSSTTSNAEAQCG
ncbi:MAG: thioredoxin domain-containing protein [Candidatus Pacearchaeota archaeon]